MEAHSQFCAVMEACLPHLGDQMREALRLSHLAKVRGRSEVPAAGHPQQTVVSCFETFRVLIDGIFIQRWWPGEA